jgi:hypothetical protein
VNLHVEAAERIAVCGENDACNFSYRCVFFLQPLLYIIQPKALCVRTVYYADTIMIVRGNRIVNYWRGTYGSSRDGKAQLIVGDGMGSHELPNIAVV